VQLARASLASPFTLAGVDEDPVLNPALQTRLLRDLNQRLPAPPDDWEQQALTAYLDAVRAALPAASGWKVEAAVQLTVLSFFKGVMYQALLDNAELAARHPLVRALAGDSSSTEGRQAGAPALVYPPLPEEHELDAVQPPQETFHVLD